MSAPILVDRPRGRGIVVIADHASKFVPEDIALGVGAEILDTHIAVDIGSEALARGLAAALGAPALLAGVSRLVVDCNREPGPEAVPHRSDGIAIPANGALSPEALERRLSHHEAYHSAVASLIDREAPSLLVSVHSFTPCLASAPAGQRPWQVGLLYNRDERAARLAIELLREENLTVGDNEPYSGARYGYTTDRHAESRGLPYLFFEVRQDLLETAKGIEEWTERLTKVVTAVESEITAEVRRAQRLG
jgi:predicted N-formylglutamate amidohydrolase